MQEMYAVLDDSKFYNASKVVSIGAKPAKLSTFDIFKNNTTARMDTVRVVETPVQAEPTDTVSQVESTAEVSSEAPSDSSVEEPQNEEVTQTLPSEDVVRGKVDALGITVYNNTGSNVVMLDSYRRLKTNPVVGLNLKNVLNLTGVDPEINKVVDSEPVVEPVNEDVTSQEVVSLTTDTEPKNNTYDFGSGLANMGLSDKATSVNDEPSFADTKANDERLNNYLSGNLTSPFNIDQYRQELEDLNNAKSNLAEMDNNVAECKQQISDLEGQLAELTSKIVKEKNKVSRELSDKTAEYRDLRAQIIQMQQYLAQNDMDDSYKGKAA